MTQDNDSSLWYYLQENQPVGPLPLSSIKALLRAGQLRPDSLIVTEGSEDWQAIADVLGPLAVPSVPPALPSQSQPQTSPPEPEKWHEKKRVVLTSLFFCFPAGLLFLWNSRRFSLPMKIGLTVPVVMVATAFLLDHGEAIERGPTSKPAVASETRKRTSELSVPDATVIRYHNFQLFDFTPDAFVEALKMNASDLGLSHKIKNLHTTVNRMRDGTTVPGVHFARLGYDHEHDPYFSIRSDESTGKVHQVEYGQQRATRLALDEVCDLPIALIATLDPTIDPKLRAEIVTEMVANSIQQRTTQQVHIHNLVIQVSNDSTFFFGVYRTEANSVTPIKTIDP